MKYLKIHLFTLSPFSLLQMLLQITSSKSVKTIRKAHRRSVLPLPTIPPPPSQTPFSPRHTHKIYAYVQGLQGDEPHTDPEPKKHSQDSKKERT